jgi:signal transduction histidine kinase
LLTRAELARARTSATFVDKPSVPGLDEGARLLAAPLGHEVIVAGVTRENRAEVLRTLRNAFLLGGPLALLLTALGGYALAGAALRPIEAMRRRAHAISVESLQERLPVPPADDEVARLGETLNAMLARLEAGVERERRFVADASHELRTPLALLKTELELALRQPLSADELRAALEAAADASARLERLAEDLLVLARADQGRLRLAKSEVDVLDVLQSVARSFEPRVAVERRAIAIADADAPVVVADRLRLEQAVANLVDNALRHGAGNVTLLARSRDGRTELHVLDSGAGFDPRFAQRAFDRFSRADEARSDDGAGLGLAIVAMIARAHGGDAHVRNRPEGGADAWIELPAREPATAARTP